MHPIHKASELHSITSDWRREGLTIGFVPTMGALHEGHLSLVREARKQCSKVVTSIFVNPTQFNDKHDLETYPRWLDADEALLESEGVDIVFAPTEQEMYPEPDKREFDLGSVAQTMEGPLRPGHFNGVCQIVSRLFDIVLPHKAFFGEKDFQQVAVIRRMLELTGQNVEIVPCPIIRELDGLARSSRNVRLLPQERAIAPAIHKALVESTQEKIHYSPSELSQRLIEKLNTLPHLRVEYYNIVDKHTLKPIREWTDSSAPVGCIAVYCGQVRLIDNIRY